MTPSIIAEWAGATGAWLIVIGFAIFLIVLVGEMKGPRQ